MSGMFDDQKFPFKCPGCGHRLQERIGRLKRNPEITCLGCGQRIAIDANDLRRGLERVEKELDELGRSFSKAFK